MVTIQLRGDGWFEAGKDWSENSYLHMIYKDKQTIKNALTELSERKLDRNSLQQLLSEIELKHFKGAPYIRGNEVRIDTHGLPGECYLGLVIE